MQGNSPATGSATTIAGMTLTANLCNVTRPKGVALDRGAMESDVVPRIVSSLTLTGTVGQDLSYTISAYNYPTSYAVTGLPAGTGLSINTSTCVISGTPKAVGKGTRSITLKATNAVGTGTATAQLTIN